MDKACSRGVGEDWIDSIVISSKNLDHLVTIANPDQVTMTVLANDQDFKDFKVTRKFRDIGN